MPTEAAYDICKFLRSVKHVVPMRFETLQDRKEAIKELNSYLEKYSFKYDR